MKYLISTLGCKVNQYETQAIETILQSRGHIPAKKGERADAVIVNTCAVTAESGRKSRQLIRRLREENPGCLTAVCGCYSQLSPDEVAEVGGNVIFGTNDKLKFVDTIEMAVYSDDNFLKIDKPFERHEFEVLPAGAVNGRTRALLKIQDGCVNFCSYCIIPYTRGRLRSLPVEDAVKEVIRLREEGYKELVITGIEIASYGADLPDKPGLDTVLKACAENAGDMRIRLGSLEPRIITKEFCQTLAPYKNLCRHFHLALQSGCDETLKAMNRKYDTARFYESCALLREYFPGCGITCDMITGFPGETEEDFESTLEFIQKCAFSNMHIFPYSRRPGTPADKMPNQCTNKVKSERSARAIAIANRMHREFMEQSVGKVLPVLFETQEKGMWTGHSDTYVLVKTEGEKLRNKVLNIRITGIDGDCLTGSIEE